MEKIIFWLLLTVVLELKPARSSNRHYSKNVDLSSICKKIWNSEKNYNTFGKDYELNLQGHVSYTKEETDKAALPLFTYFDKKILKKPTFKAFVALLDNYQREAGVTETMTKTEKEETWKFIDAVSKTGPILEVHKYLVQKELAPKKMEQFKQELFKIWFSGYRRKSSNDSSGFEHVFIGEVWHSKVTGLHNWLQFYNLEKEHEVDYLGYYDYFPEEPVRLKIQFLWGKYRKKQSSIFLGTSPEFEMALYTLCFYMREGKGCRCRMNGQKISVSTHKNLDSGLIRAAFPNS